MTVDKQRRDTDCDDDDDDDVLSDISVAVTIIVGDVILTKRRL